MRKEITVDHAPVVFGSASDLVVIQKPADLLGCLRYARSVATERVGGWQLLDFVGADLRHHLREGRRRRLTRSSCVLQRVLARPAGEGLVFTQRAAMFAAALLASSRVYSAPCVTFCATLLTAA